MAGHSDAKIDVPARSVWEDTPSEKHGYAEAEEEVENSRGCGRRCCGFLAAVPYVAIGCCLLWIGGLVVWCFFAREAKNALISVLLDPIQANPSAVNNLNTVATDVLLGVTIGLSVFAGLLLLVAVLRAVQVATKGKISRAGRRSLKATGTLNIIFNVLLWLCVLAVVINIVITAVLVAYALAISYVADQGADIISTVITKANAASTTAKLALQKFPAQYQNFTSTLTEEQLSQPVFVALNATAAKISQMGRTVRYCPSSCLDLGNLPEVLDIKVQCICAPTDLYAISSGLSQAAKWGAVGIGGLAAMYFAGSWMNIALAYVLAQIRGDAREVKRAIASGKALP